MFEGATKGLPWGKHQSSISNKKKVFAFVCVCVFFGGGWVGCVFACERVCAEYKRQSFCVACNVQFKENLIPSFVPQQRAQFRRKQ